MDRSKFYSSNLLNMFCGELTRFLVITEMEECVTIHMSNHVLLIIFLSVCKSLMGGGNPSSFRLTSSTQRRGFEF